jgi:glycosyltransferase involved in cell wall biosynthesis
MRISVIIPAYNAARFLPDTIESVLRQSSSDWELLIINDGSQDRTGEIASQYAEQDARIRSFDIPNAGVAAARNAGFQRSDRQSQFICYLDHDDAWLPNALESLTSALEAHPDAVAASGLPESIDATGRPAARDDVRAYCRDRWAVEGARLIRQPEDQRTTFSCFAVRNCVITPGLMMIRRSAHEQCGAFDESLSGYDDWDMWLRLSRLGDFAFLNRTVLQYRLHESNQSRAHKTMERQERLLYSKLFSTKVESPERLDQLRWGFRHRARLNYLDRMSWARDAFRNGQYVAGLAQLRHGARMYWSYLTGFGVR